MSQETDNSINKINYSKYYKKDEKKIFGIPGKKRLYIQILR